MLDVVELSRQLIRMDTTNPPGGEEKAAVFLAGILEKAGCETSLFPMAPERAGLLARLPGRGEKKPFCLTGHLDTVPLGDASWSFDPFGAEIREGRLLGRGSSDMKSGVAALTAALAGAAELGAPAADVWLILTPSEETGCKGAGLMAGQGVLPPEAGALVVAEPTGNQPMLGHKGASWFEGRVRGKAAHGSMPWEGDNAIYKAARAVLSLEHFFDNYPAHPLAGRPTLNVGTIKGGIKTNMVPDLAVFQVDVRTIPEIDGQALFRDLSRALGPEVELTMGTNSPGVYTPPDHPWIERALELAAGSLGVAREPGFLTYFTDASALSRALKSPPVLILGPGEAAQAHQTDEYCLVDRIPRAAEVYLDLIRDWCGI